MLKLVSPIQLFKASQSVVIPKFLNVATLSEKVQLPSSSPQAVVSDQAAATSPPTIGGLAGKDENGVVHVRVEPVKVPTHHFEQNLLPEGSLYKCRFIHN